MHCYDAVMPYEEDVLPPPSSPPVRSRRSSWPPCSPHTHEANCDTQLLVGDRGDRGGQFRIQPESVSGETDNSVITNSSTDRKRRIASIFQHYYPEGGWGIVLLLVVVIVQMIVHGFLLSYGVLLSKVVRRFRVSLVEAGTYLFQHLTRDRINTLNTRLLTAASCRSNASLSGSYFTLLLNLLSLLSEEYFIPSEYFLA